MISAETISTLIDAGLSGETLKTVVAAIERDMERYALLREHVTHSDVTRYATEVSPAALRMRKMREKQRVLKGEQPVTASVTEASQGVTSYNNNTSLSIGLEKKDSIVGKRTALRQRYATDFETEFWKAFPTDKGMSKLEAWKAWEKLAPDERKAAVAGIPGFKAWVREQGPTYRVVHACRYLSQRRFEGFGQEAESQPVSAGTWADPSDPRWEALEAAYINAKGKKPPRDSKGGWTFFETTDDLRGQAA